MYSVTVTLMCTVFDAGAWDRQTDGQIAAPLNAFYLYGRGINRAGKNLGF